MEIVALTFAQRAAPNSGYLKVVRASAIYDLVITAPFATPWSFGTVHAVLNATTKAIGGDAFPDLDVMHILYANLMGSVVVIWSLLRVVRPIAAYGFYDGLARMLFSTWMLYALIHGAPQVLWLFLVIEIAWGALQLVPWLSGHFRGRPCAGSSFRSPLSWFGK
jgi:hypothetical protein